MLAATPGWTELLREPEEQELDESQTQNFISAGLIRQMGENAGVSFGLGLGGDSPRGKVTLGFSGWF
jgi:hypothetical protein